MIEFKPEGIMYMVRLKTGYTADVMTGGVMRRICDASGATVSIERWHITLHHTREDAELCRRRHCVATAAVLEVVPVTVSLIHMHPDGTI